MDLKLIGRLVRMMEKADLTELEIEEEGMRVHMRRGSEVSATAGPVVHFSGAPGQAPAAALPAATATGEPGGQALAPAPGQGDGQGEAGSPFPSPMVGTFYRSPSPEAQPFVEPGAKVGPDTVICIIEAMKVMNEIKAELAGEVIAVLAENGDAVEFGQPLFLIGPA